MIHSIMPDEKIFEGYEEMDVSYVDVQIDGIQMQVLPISMNQAQIVRLISPNPQHYLNSSYYPGTVIHFKPEIQH